MTGFFGRHHLRVDDKGRIIIPAQFRDILRVIYGSRLYITCAAADECLQIFPDKEWEAHIDKVRGLSRASDAVKYYLRRVIGSAQEMDMDKQGRVVLPPVLREEAGIALNGEIVIVGMTDRLEAWDRPKWDKIAKPEEVNIKQYMEELAGMGL